MTMFQKRVEICTRAAGRSLRLRAAVRLAVLAASGSLATNAVAQETLPTGGQIVSGQGTIATAGGTMTVTQHTEQMIANWQSFSIGAANGVNFVQPGASSVALNRVVGQDPSQILGSLNANGHVFLVNPNGVMIGHGAQVHTGGFVAASLGIDDGDFLAGLHRFTGAGGAIRNEGDISGGVVALIAPSVSNDGTITGDAALAAGTNVLLDFDGDGLLSVEVSASTVATLVENNGLIRADGGVAILTAKGASDALRGVVNNSGTIQARTLANRNGRILLLADMEQGDVNVGGTLDASAPGSGTGGFIETSAQNVSIADDVHITTQAAGGQQGTWLIDPNDFIIAASGGNTTGNALSNVLDFTNVTIATATQGTPDRNGDIFVNDSVSWSANTLTLQAERNIVINTAMNGSGTAGLALWYGQGAPAQNNGARYIVNAPINLAATGSFATRLGNDGTIANYTIVTTLGSASSNNDGSLQGIRGDLAGNYVLGADINASATSLWSGGFTPIGGNDDSTRRYLGIFDGLGHSIHNLNINRPATNYVGLFGATGSNAIVRNVGIQGGSVTGNTYVGGLVGVNGGTIADSFSDRAGAIDEIVGGLVGFNNGSINRSHSTGGATSFGNYVGGLVGLNADGFIRQSYATGAVAGDHGVGGLAGFSSGYIFDSHATGSVVGSGSVGGLVGANQDGGISNSYATGTVGGSAARVGGLVGFNDDGNIGSSYATGTVTGVTDVGGLVGDHSLGSLHDSFATGAVTGTSQVGGLVGTNDGLLWNVYASGRVTGNQSTGGLVGHDVSGTITAAFYDIETSGQGAACGTSASGNCTATGLTTQQMQDPFSFIDAGWNFASTWGKSRTGENDGYMVLRAISGTEYDYYVRLSDVNLQRVYGSSGNPSLSGIALDGVGASLVALAWGDAITAGTHTGTYSFGGTNVLNLQLGAGTAADYYFDYGNGLLTIDRATLVGTIDSSSRTYDGQAFSGGNDITWSGFVLGEDASNLAGSLVYGGTAQGARNAGVYSLTASGLSSGNYDITYVGGVLTIDPRVISLSGTRVYDGTTEVVASALMLDNLVSGETLTLSGLGSVNDRNVGSGKALSLDTLTLGSDTGLAANYTLTGGTHSVDITRRAISVTDVVADNKVYDGTTAAALNLNSASVAGLVAGDDITLASGTGAFSDKNVGAGKVVSITGLALGGADVGNYTLTSTTAATTASITPRAIGTVTGITANDRVYDGTTDATLNFDSAGFAGSVAGDIITVAGAAGAFSDKNAGTGKAVNITGIALGGADAGNYILDGSTATTTATITPRAVSAITGITANDKDYDGSSIAILDTGRASFVGAIAGDDLVVASGQGRFASADPAVNATVYIGGLALGGADAGNYTLANDSAIATASINPVIVPPLQPQPATDGNVGTVEENLFPPPAIDVLANHPGFTIPLEWRFENECGTPGDGSAGEQCVVSPASQPD